VERLVAVVEIDAVEGQRLVEGGGQISPSAPSRDDWEGRERSI
jgi:hypothetical protein